MMNAVTEKLALIDNAEIHAIAVQTPLVMCETISQSVPVKKDTRVIQISPVIL